MTEFDFEKGLFLVNPRPIVITDARGNIKYVNDRFCDHTQISRDELLNSNTKIFRSGYTDQSVYDDLWDTIRNKKTDWEGDFINIRRNTGEVFFEHSRIHPVLNDLGNLEWIVGVKEDITEKQSYLEDLRERATKDSLTGLSNRVAFEDRLEEIIARTERDKDLTAVFFMDLDGFKQVNDIYDHSAGDLVLCEVSNRLMSCTRKSDTLARMGGDEFAMILPNVNSKYICETLAKKIIVEVSKPYNLTLDNITEDVNIGISIGIAIYDSNSTNIKSHADLIKMADIAMYKIKNGGKGSYAFFN